MLAQGQQTKPNPYSKLAKGKNGQMKSSNPRNSNSNIALNAKQQMNQNQSTISLLQKQNSSAHILSDQLMELRADYTQIDKNIQGNEEQSGQQK